MEDKFGDRRDSRVFTGFPRRLPWGSTVAAQEAYLACVITYKLREVWGQDGSANRTFRNKIPGKTSQEQ